MAVLRDSQLGRRENRERVRGRKEPFRPARKSIIRSLSTSRHLLLDRPALHRIDGLEASLLIESLACEGFGQLRHPVWDWQRWRRHLPKPNSTIPVSRRE